MGHKLIKSNFNTSDALRELHQHPQWWKEITVRQEAAGSPHRDTECIYIRGPYELTWAGFQQDLRAKDYPAKLALPACWALVNKVLNLIPHDIVGRVIIAKLLPKGEVLAHNDEGAYANFYERYHLPIKTNPDVVSVNDGHHQIMNDGELWKFDHRLVHRAFNSSDEERIMLIIDVAKLPKEQS